MSSTALMSFDDLNVEALAVIANESAEQVESSARKTVEHAERCGRALLAAKEKLSHGQWAAWLGSNFDYSQSIANRYMVIASNSARVPNLKEATSLREALRMIAEDPETPKRKRKPGVEILPSAPIEVEAKPLPERTAGETAVNAAAIVADMPRDEQKKLAAAGQKAIKEATSRARNEKPAFNLDEFDLARHLDDDRSAILGAAADYIEKKN